MRLFFNRVSALVCWGLAGFPLLQGLDRIFGEWIWRGPTREGCGLSRGRQFSRFVLPTPASKLAGDPGFGLHDGLRQSGRRRQRGFYGTAKAVPLPDCLRYAEMGGAYPLIAMMPR
jgi:hypothetical protein